ncbi:Hypothetical protein A7982_01616 [Minicystis rosea]|nr:Hypothetical protein A7982_01616 [Minicystis rosea]
MEEHVEPAGCRIRRGGLGVGDRRESTKSEGEGRSCQASAHRAQRHSARAEVPGSVTNLGPSARFRRPPHAPARSPPRAGAPPCSRREHDAFTHQHRHSDGHAFTDSISPRPLIEAPSRHRTSPPPAMNLGQHAFEHRHHEEESRSKARCPKCLVHLEHSYLVHGVPSPGRRRRLGQITDRHPGLIQSQQDAIRSLLQVLFQVGDTALVCWKGMSN